MKLKRMPRVWNTLSEKEVCQKVFSSDVKDFSTGGLANGPYMPSFTDRLIGREFVFSFPETNPSKIAYRFTEKHKLFWSEDCLSWYEGYYQGAEPEENLFFIQHTRHQADTPGGGTLILDLNTGLVTAVLASFGNYRAAREVKREFCFGRIQGISSNENIPLHQFSEYLVGKSIQWTYHPGMAPIKHIYSSPSYYTYVMRNDDSEWIASNPADYVKINDHLYLFSFLEERQAGIQGSFLINIHTMQDVGSFFGINGNDCFECYLVGAKGELIKGDYRI